jgi:hypothetical protein
MNWVRIQQIRRRNVRRDFLRTGFIGLPAAVGEPAWSAGKEPHDVVRGGIVDWFNKQRHVRVISHFFAGECKERGRPVKALRFAPTATRRKECGLD